MTPIATCNSGLHYQGVQWPCPLVKAVKEVCFRKPSKIRVDFGVQWKLLSSFWVVKDNLATLFKEAYLWKSTNFYWAGFQSINLTIDQLKSQWVRHRPCLCHLLINIAIQCQLVEQWQWSFFTVHYKIFQASFSLQSSYLRFYFPFKSFPWLILTEPLNVSILKRLLPVLLVELLRVGGGLVRLGWVSKNSLILPLAVQLRLIFFLPLWMRWHWIVFDQQVLSFPWQEIWQSLQDRSIHIVREHTQPARCMHAKLSLT